MKKIILSIIAAFLFSYSYSQNLTVSLVNKVVSGNTWTFTVQATAMPTYTGDQDNWSTINARYDLLLPAGTTITSTGTSSGTPAGVTLAVQSAVPGTPTAPANAEMGVALSRDASSNPDLVIGSPTNLGTITVTFSNPLSASANTHDLRDNTTTAGSFYVNPDNTSERKPLSTEAAFALPIKMKSFFAEKFGTEKASNLTWTTSSEVNGSHFEIERSEDTKSWTYLGSVKAAGNSSIDKDYNFIDRTLPVARTNDETYFYRLKLVDLDGSTDFSEIRTVKFDKIDIALSVGPNPTARMLSVFMTSPKGTDNEAPLTFIDNSGRLVLSRNISTNGVTEIDMQGIANGLYNVTVKINDQIITKSVIKSN